MYEVYVDGQREFSYDDIGMILTMADLVEAVHGKERAKEYQNQYLPSGLLQTLRDASKIQRVEMSDSDKEYVDMLVEFGDFSAEEVQEIARILSDPELPETFGRIADVFEEAAEDGVDITIEHDH